MKKNNDILRKEVKESLKWEPILHSTEIDVLRAPFYLLGTCYYKKQFGERYL